MQTIQTHARGFLHKVDIPPLSVALTDGAAHSVANREFHVRFSVADDLLNAILHRVGELAAVLVKELDAVVLHRVVAGGNHRTRVRLIIPGQIRNAGGRQHIHQHRPRTHAANARYQRRLQHFTADARIPTH